MKLTFTQICEYTQHKPATIRRWLQGYFLRGKERIYYTEDKRKIIPIEKKGRFYIYSSQDIDTFLLDMKKKKRS